MKRTRNTIAIHLQRVKGFAPEEKTLSKIRALQGEIDQLRGIEQRCQQAEKKLQAIEARNRLLGDNAPFGIFTVDLHGRITGFNRHMREMAGWRSAKHLESPYHTDSQIMIPASIAAEVEICIVTKKMHIAEHSYDDGQGKRVHLRYYFSPIPGSDGVISEVMVFVEDFTDLKRTENDLKESEKRYRQLYQSAPIAMIERDVTLLQAHLKKLREFGVADLRQYLQDNPRQVYHCWSLIKTIDHNPAYYELMEFQAGAHSAGAFPLPAQEIFLKMAREIILTIAQGNNVNEGELEVVTARGQKKIVLGKSMVVSGSRETSDRVVVALVDITRRKEVEESLRKSELRFKDQSLRDNLTGLFNQRYLYQSLPGLIETAQNDGTHISLIFMDLDHFKRIVDTYGHLNGSRAIREVALTIDSCLQVPAYGVAYAGDEFVIVLPGYDQYRAIRKATEIRDRMSDTVYTLDQGIEVRLAASFGVATFPENADDSKSLISAADQALFVVKETGKNGVGVYQKI